MREIIHAIGHRNITATHKTTFEITKEKDLSPRGDCIIGVSADKGISEISEKIKHALKEGKKAKIILELPEYSLREEVEGYGSKNLTFTHQTDIVVRRSEYVCGRTLLINATKSAINLSRDFINFLRNPETELLFIIEIMQ